MLKILSNEGEVVIKLVNVELMDEQKWFDKMYNELNETEANVVREVCFEGYFVENENDYDENDYMEMTFEEYISDLKDWVKEVLETE